METKINIMIFFYLNYQTQKISNLCVKKYKTIIHKIWNFNISIKF